ncbi:hypothetical protein EB230_30660 [Mesorhizobium sp. NZP2234]|nr:hypothetical protein EB230_30660 [Mesorhizobium sp. NZP2234]
MAHEARSVAHGDSASIIEVLEAVRRDFGKDLGGVNADLGLQFADDPLAAADALLHIIDEDSDLIVAVARVAAAVTGIAVTAAVAWVATIAEAGVVSGVGMAFTLLFVLIAHVSSP